jgi:hypothetical protein
MIQLGTNYMEFHQGFSNPQISVDDFILLARYLNRKMEEMDSNEEFETDFIELFGGYFKIVEDRVEDFQDMRSHLNPDIRNRFCNVDGFDFVECLAKDKLYVVGVCTNNQGGNHYIINESLLQKYPSIKTYLRERL